MNHWYALLIKFLLVDKEPVSQIAFESTDFSEVSAMYKQLMGGLGELFEYTQEYVNENTDIVDVEVCIVKMSPIEKWGTLEEIDIADD